MLVVRALKNSQLTDGESHVIYGTGHSGEIKVIDQVTRVSFG